MERNGKEILYIYVCMYILGVTKWENVEIEILKKVERRNLNGVRKTKTVVKERYLLRIILYIFLLYSLLIFSYFE